MIYQLSHAFLGGLEKTSEKNNRSFFQQFLMNSGPITEWFKSLKLWHYFTRPMTINMSQIFYFTLLIM